MPSTRRLTDGQRQLVQENVGLVWSAIRRMFGNSPPDGHSDDDLLHFGIIGLARAVRCWHPSKGALSTYSYRPIRQAIAEGIRCARMIRISRQEEQAGVRPPSCLSWREPDGDHDDDASTFDGLACDPYSELAFDAVDNALDFAEVERRVPRGHRLIFRLRADGLTHEQIGWQLGIGARRVRQILEAVTGRLRDQLTVLGG